MGKIVQLNPNKLFKNIFNFTIGHEIHSELEIITNVQIIGKKRLQCYQKDKENMTHQNLMSHLEQSSRKSFTLMTKFSIQLNYQRFLHAGWFVAKALCHVIIKCRSY